MDALNNAIDRAGRGLDWSYPCLIWVADYLLEATGTDFAEGWRDREWTQDLAMREMLELGRGSNPGTPVARALETMARRRGWQEVDGARQGAIMIGVYSDPLGVGFPAIYDGWKGWLVAMFGNAAVVREQPERMWEIAT